MAGICHQVNNSPVWYSRGPQFDPHSCDRLPQVKFSVAFLSPFPRMLTLNPATGHGRCLPSQFIITHALSLSFQAVSRSTVQPVTFRSPLLRSITTDVLQFTVHTVTSVCPSKQYQQLQTIAQYSCTFIQKVHFAVSRQLYRNPPRHIRETLFGITVKMLLVSEGTIYQSVSQSVTTRSSHSNISR